MSRIFHMSLANIEESCESDSMRFVQLRDFAMSTLQECGEAHRMSIQPLQIPGVIPRPTHDVRQIQRQPRNVRRRRRQLVDEEIDQDNEPHPSPPHVQHSPPHAQSSPPHAHPSPPHAQTNVEYYVPIHDIGTSSMSSPVPNIYPQISTSSIPFIDPQHPFGQPSSSFMTFKDFPRSCVMPSSSTVSFPNFQTPVSTYRQSTEESSEDEDVDEEIQLERSTSHQGDNENAGLRRSTRVRHPPACGTHGKLGHK